MSGTNDPKEHTETIEEAIDALMRMGLIRFGEEDEGEEEERATNLCLVGKSDERRHD